MHNPLGLDMIKLMKTKDVQDALGVSRTTLWRFVKAGTLRPPIKLSAQCNRWRPSDIEAALEALRPSPTAA